MEKVVCVDLRRFDPESRDHGVGAYLERLSFMPSALCFLNFHVMFVLEYEGICDKELDPISVGQNGTPCPDRWTVRAFHSLVQTIRGMGIEVYFGLLANTTSPVWHNTAYEWTHPELLQTSVGGERVWGNAVNVLKRFDDGRYLDEVIARNLGHIFRDFGFDAYVAGDGMLGLRGPRDTLRETDFSRDMVEQFSQHSSIEVDGRLDYEGRRRFISEGFYDEWVDFWCWRWACHVGRIHDAIAVYGASFMALDAWSRSPEECRRLFGIDYRMLCDKGLEKVFVRCGESSKWRKHREGEYARQDCSMYTIMAHALYEPRLSYLWVQPTANVPEFWNTVQDLPQVSRRELSAYFALHVMSDEDGCWKKALDGVCIIWGNDLSHEDWTWLASGWESVMEWNASFLKPFGPVLLVPDSTSSKPGSHMLFARLYDAGLPISCAMHMDQAKAGHVFITFDEDVATRMPGAFHFDGERFHLDGCHMSFLQGVEKILQRCGISHAACRWHAFMASQSLLYMCIENAESLEPVRQSLTIQGKSTCVTVPPDGVACAQMAI